MPTGDWHRASIASRVPVIGPWAVKLMLGGPIIAARRCHGSSRSTFLCTGLLIAFSSALLMVLKLESMMAYARTRASPRHDMQE